MKEDKNGSDKNVGSMEEMVKNFIQTYNELKRNKDIVKSIDKDYFFDLMDCLIKVYKELEENNKLLIQQNITYKRNINDLKHNKILVSLVEQMIEELWIKCPKNQTNRFAINERNNKIAVLQELLKRRD